MRTGVPILPCDVILSPTQPIKCAFHSHEYTFPATVSAVEKTSTSGHGVRQLCAHGALCSEAHELWVGTGKSIASGDNLIIPVHIIRLRGYRGKEGQPASLDDLNIMVDMSPVTMRAPGLRRAATAPSRPVSSPDFL